MSSTTRSPEIVHPVIQVGVDGAWREAGALDWALHESLLRREPLHAVHVVERKARRTRYYEPVVTAQAEAELVDDVRAWMKLNGQDLDHEAALIDGPAATGLTSAARGSRMLVVGRRGMGSFKRLLLGSTSEAVTSLGQGPVVVGVDMRSKACWKRPKRSMLRCWCSADTLVGTSPSCSSAPLLEASFSTPPARSRWSTVTPSDGRSGSG